MEPRTKNASEGPQWGPRESMTLLNHGLRRVDGPEKTGLTLAAHFGYGTAAGVLFGLLAPKRAGEAVPAGIGFGLLVWSASYLGLMPALGLHPPATRDTFRRNALMIAAHVVWGASLGALAAPLRRAIEK